MTRFLIWTAAGLLIGLAVHLVTLLALPSLAHRSAYQRLATLGADGVFHVIAASGPTASLLPKPDPALRMAACRYDLDQGPLHIRAPVPGGFFSVSFYTSRSLNFYALNDRAASNGIVELTLYTPVQLSEVRSREGPDTPETLRIEAPEPKGVVVLRALAPTAGSVPAVEDLLAQASCGPDRTAGPDHFWMGRSSSGQG